MRLNEYENTAAEQEQQSTATAPSSPTYSETYHSSISQPPKKVRRVGTMTMGIALIAAGICAIVSLFYPQFDIIAVLKLAPAVLIFLGLEILINYFFHREDTLKYDFLSGFVCFLLICASVGAVAIPPIWKQYGPMRYQLENDLQADAEDLCYQALQDSPVASIHTWLELHQQIPEDGNLTLAELKASDRIGIDISLTGTYKDKAEFAAACQQVLTQLQTTGLRFRSIDLSTAEEQKDYYSYYLSLGNAVQINQSVESLTQMVRGDQRDAEELSPEERIAQAEEEIRLAREELGMEEESEPDEELSSDISNEEGPESLPQDTSSAESYDASSSATLETSGIYLRDDQTVIRLETA